MASKLHLQTPYVLKTLSRPLDRPDGPGRHTIAEVFGQKPAGKRRKRSELAVAIDGDAIHLYDIISSQALTSYLVSPQSFFTCAPYSLRWRGQSANSATRYTYASVQDSRSKKEIKLFKEDQDDSGSKTASTASHTHRCDQPIVFLTATAPKTASSSLETALPNHDLLAVSADGTVLALHGETLESKWQSSPRLFTQELSSGAKGFQVDYVLATLAADVVDGLFGGKNDLFGVFQEKVHRDGFNPDMLLAITSAQDEQDGFRRHIHILALPEDRPSRQASGQNIISVFVAPLPTQIRPTKIQFDVKSGTLQELCDGNLYTYTFKSGMPYVDNQLPVPGMTSFLRLTRSSVLTVTDTALSVYSPAFRSLQTSTPVATNDADFGNSKGSLELVSYLSAREMAVGFRDSSLVAIQIEAPASRSNKRRADGLLVDAIRRGMPRVNNCQKRAQQEDVESLVLTEPHPALFSEESQREWEEKRPKAEELLQAGDFQGFEALLAEVFKVQVEEQQSEAAGDDVATLTLPKWTWLGPGMEYPEVDRRWVIFAIQKVFAWDTSDGADATPRLQCQMPESNVLGYLIAAGHLSIANAKSAFKEQAQQLDEFDIILGEQLPSVLVEADPTMQLLLGYLSATHLGPTELTAAVKLLLRSLDLLNDPSKLKSLTFGESEQEADSDNDAIAMELDRAEEELQTIEYYLDAESDSRADALSIAFSKLAACPTATTVRSLRRLFKPEETICLMNVLRAELFKGGWTTRYLDRSAEEEEEEAEADRDGSIKILADLMCRCIDSVGIGGWMAFDSVLAKTGDSEESLDFFTQCKAEVSAALEGIQEAVRLNGILSEAINYMKRNNGRKPQMQTRMLPFGLKVADPAPSADRVRSGGELVQRTRRHIGDFQSRKRKLYSVVRITEEELMGRSVKSVEKWEE